MKSGVRTSGMLIALAGLASLTSNGVVDGASAQRDSEARDVSAAGEETRSDGRKGGQVQMIFGTLSSCGAHTYANGSVVILGQPLVGNIASAQYAMQVGVVPIITAATAAPTPQAPLPEDSLSVICTGDTDCVNEAYCVPDGPGVFPGTCYVPKNRYLSVAPNVGNTAATARRVKVITFERSCGGAGNTSCVSNTDCAGNPDGSTCDDVGTGSKIVGWFGQPDADGYAAIVTGPNRHYAIWADLTFPVECGVDELCPAGAHCDVGLGGSNTCRWDADDTEVPSSVVHLSGCQIAPKSRDVRPGANENRAANHYAILAIADGADISDPSNYSPALLLRTVVVWGDMTGGTSGNVALPPEGAAGFTDILHQVFRFKDNGKATTAWLDLDPQVPDRNVGFLDMLNAVEGFKDEPYPWDDPCTCVGLPPCN